MKRTVWDTVLAVLYLPFAFFCFLSGMAIEGVMTQTAPAALFAAYAVGWSGPLVAFLAYPCLILAIWLRRKGKARAARWLRFAPLMTMAAVWGVCALVEWIW